MGVDLSLVCKGFDEPVKDSQSSFRTILNALSQPGTVGHLDVIPLGHAPEKWTEAAWALAMTLLDGDTRVWLSPSLATAVAHASLQFHTSCPITHDPGEADFIFVGNVNEQPDWSSLRHGERSFCKFRELKWSSPALRMLPRMLPRPAPGNCGARGLSIRA